MGTSIFSSLSDDELLCITQFLTPCVKYPDELKLLYSHCGPFHRVTGDISNSVSIFFQGLRATVSGVGLDFSLDSNICHNIIQHYGHCFETVCIHDFPPTRGLEAAKRLISVLVGSCTNVRSLRITSEAESVYWKYLLKQTLSSWNNLAELEIDACSVSVPFMKSNTNAFQTSFRTLRKLTIKNIYRLDHIPWFSLTHLKFLSISATQAIPWKDHFNEIAHYCTEMRSIKLDIGRSPAVAHLISKIAQRKILREASFHCPWTKDADIIEASCRGVHFSISATTQDAQNIAKLARNIRSLKIYGRGQTSKGEIEPQFQDALNRIEYIESITIFAPFGCSMLLDALARKQKTNLRQLVVIARNWTVEAADIAGIFCSSPYLFELSITANIFQGIDILKDVGNLSSMRQVILKENGTRSINDTRKSIMATLRSFLSSQNLTFLSISYNTMCNVLCQSVRNELSKHRYKACSVEIHTNRNFMRYPHPTIRGRSEVSLNAFINF